MNSLTEFIQRHKLDADHCMNLLQDHSIISDNAVNPEDVAECDCWKAIKFLRKRLLPPRYTTRIFDPRCRRNGFD